MLRRSFLASSLALAAQPQPRPNILWITCEDLSPVLGCYGDPLAKTPHLDRLATQSTRYTQAFSPASVCTPARSCIITGVYPNTLGSVHLRGQIEKPSSVRCFPEYLRDAGYYTSNNVKEDYNFKTPSTVWNESSDKAHWRKRSPGQPFFSVFNIMATHQGQIRYSPEEFEKTRASMPANLRHDPAAMRVPPYYPDTPEVRRNLAMLYTQVTRMDERAGQILAELESDGLAENTVVFFYSDHGTGLPRHKRFLNDSGLRVPMLIRFPDRFRNLAPTPAGKTTGRLVSFVDFAPTVLSLAGLAPQPFHQGFAFLGPRSVRPRDYVFATRDRVDEEFETSRTISDGRYQYIRHYTPHRPRLEHSTYSEVGPVWQEFRRLAGSTQLTGGAKTMLDPHKPAEEFFDLASDPHQIRNLASDPQHSQRIAALRRRMHEWMLANHDNGLLPESEMRRNGPAETSALLDAAERVGRGASHLPRITKGLAASSPGVRYWASVACSALGPGAAPAIPALENAARSDESPAVRIAAAEALCHAGKPAPGVAALAEAIKSTDAVVQLQAANSLWYIGELARPALPAMQTALAAKTQPAEHREYVEWSLDKSIKRLQARS
jgi:arylsulfatase A-like enzyme